MTVTIKTLSVALILFSVLATCGCKKKNDKGDGEWLISENDVLDGGPGKDGIPSIDKPVFTAVTNIAYLNDNDMIIGVKEGGEVRGYPHPILDWHEIINDELDGKAFSITYCPLTGSGIWWGRTLGGQKTEFGVSGLLYNSNLIPYDRDSDSNWSQMLLKCVNGSKIGEEVSTNTIIETTWATWKLMYPDSKVISESTGFNRNYGSYPYGDYKTNHGKLLFPIDHENNTIPRKERVIGVISGSASKAYQFSHFADSINVVHDIVGSDKIVVAGSQPDNILMAFNSVIGGTELNFTSVQDSLPVIMKDNEGNRWDIFGYAVSGPRLGSRLNHQRSFIGYWFAWATFYPTIEIYN